MVSVEEPNRVLIELLNHFQREVETAIETLEVMQDRELLESIERPKRFRERPNPQPRRVEG